MNQTTQQKTEARLPDFEWRVHPFMESRLRAILSVAAPLVISFLVHLWLGSWLWTGLGFLLLVSAELPFFLISYCRFDAQGASMRRAGTTISKRWEQLKSYYPDRNGVLLSPFTRPFWLENFRGLYLPFGRHRDEVLRQIEARMGPPPDPSNKR